MTRRSLLPVGIIIVSLMLAACDTAPPPAASPTAGAGASPTAGAGGSPAASPGGATGTRLAQVKSRGTLICGVNGSLPGFSVVDQASGAYSGFDVDYCKALAAAVLGDATKVEYRALSAAERGPALQTGEVDVLIRNTTWTVSRDTSWGLFAPTTFYDGQGMMVNSTLTDATTLEDLADSTICVQSGTTTELNLTDQMRALGIAFEPLVFAEIDPTYAAYAEGRCDAVTSDRSQLVARRTALTTPADHVLLDAVMSKEPLGPVAPLNDTQWFNVVKWVVYATFEAEEQGITQANVASMTSDTDPVIRRLLGVETPELGTALGLEADWVVDVITAVGNYAEIYDRNLGPSTPFDLARGPNELWTADPPGLLYAPPYR
jgi:general L-amino acid transport system substrate-binding protein